MHNKSHIDDLSFPKQKRFSRLLTTITSNKIDKLKNDQANRKTISNPKPKNTIKRGHKKLILYFAISLTISMISMHNYPSAYAKDLDLDILVHHDGEGIAEICLDSKKHEKSCEQYELHLYQDPFVIPYEIEDTKPNKEFELCYKIDQENQKGCNSFESGENYQQIDLYLPGNELTDTVDENISDIENIDDSISESLKEVITYRNPEYDFKIDYPINYEKVVKDFDLTDRVIDVVTFFQPYKEIADNFQEYYGVVVDPSPYENNLDKYLIETIEDYSSGYSNFIEIESNTNSYLSGQNAYKLVYSYTQTNPEMAMKAMEIGTIIDGKVYYIEYHAAESEFDEYVSNIEYWINSFQIL